MIDAYSYIGGCRSFPQNFKKSRLNRGGFSFGPVNNMASRCLKGIFRSSFGQRNYFYSYPFFSKHDEHPIMLDNGL